MKHNWYKNEDGSIDEFSLETGIHNGPVCQNCGYSPCVHCTPNYDTDDCSTDDCSTDEPETNAPKKNDD